MHFLSINTAGWPHQSVYYALPYLTLGVFVCIIGYKELRYSKKLTIRQAICLFVAFLLFFGLRWHIMSDSLAYEEEYYSFKPFFSWKYIDAHSYWWDKGFVVFAMICKLITSHFFFFVFVNTLVDISLFTLCLKKYEVNVTIVILTFLAFQGILMEINTMRNIKAILLFLYSISYIQERKLLKFFLVNALGFTFHSSALLYFPMYWLLGRKYSMKILLPLAGLITVIYLANINILQEYLMSKVLDGDSAAMTKFAYYLNNTEEATFSIGFIERLLTLTLCLIVYRHQKENSFNLVMLNSFFVFYLLYSVFGFNIVFRDRIPYLFIYAYWFVYPYFYDHFGRRGWICKLLFMALFFGKIYLSTRLCSSYYETVLFHETNRSQRQHFCDILSN